MINMDICETKIEALSARVGGNVERATQLLAMPDSELRTEYVMDCWQRNCVIEMDIRSFQRWMSNMSSPHDSTSAARVLHESTQLCDFLKKSQWSLLDVLV